MKVLHLIDHLGLGGAQALLLDQLEARSPDIESTVWTLRDRALPTALERLRSTNVAHRTLALSKYNPLGWLELRRQLALKHPDILNTRLDYGNAAGIAAAISPGRPRPLIVSHIDGDPSQQYGWFNRAMIRRLASQVDVFVALSASLGRATASEFPAARRIEVISPGIDLTRFTADRADPVEVGRLRAGASRVIGTVGRLDDQKSLDMLLDATPALLDDDPDTRILIVGEGPRRAALQRRAGRLGIERNVTFTGYRADVVTAYCAMDVFALPSRHEGFGLVFAEAMALGVPVVGTRVVGSVDAVEDGVTGLLVEHGDPAALAAAILRLCRDQDLRRALADNAGERVRREWTRETLVRRTEALYRQLWNERRRASPGAG